jgi:hypothetical protein
VRREDPKAQVRRIGKPIKPSFVTGADSSSTAALSLNRRELARCEIADLKHCGVIWALYFEKLYVGTAIPLCLTRTAPRIHHSAELDEKRSPIVLTSRLYAWGSSDRTARSVAGEFLDYGAGPRAFESGFLQQRVCQLAVPERRLPADSAAPGCVIHSYGTHRYGEQ